MINLFSTHIASLSIHRVGNKSRNEAIFLSAEPYKMDDEITPLLKEFFLKPFREKEENYFQFSHEADLEFHELYNSANTIFDNPATIHEESRKIATYLYNQSEHPHIKSGEVYVAYLENVQLDNVKMDAIGIFKSELKQDFLQFAEEGNQLEAMLQHGVSLNKLDKGCMIFNVPRPTGFEKPEPPQTAKKPKHRAADFLRAPSERVKQRTTRGDTKSPTTADHLRASSEN